jgi:hypothetical protein
VSGPLLDRWPPQETIDFLGSIPWKKLEHTAWDPVRHRHVQVALESNDSSIDSLRDWVARFAPRAYCRPPSEAEVNDLVQVGTSILENGGTMERAVRAVGEALLMSPAFLFETALPGKLDDGSLARRLALFLWRGLPDSELLQLALEKKLTDPAILRAQVDRMLADPRSMRMVEDFVRQWLRLSEIDATSPDTQLYPEFDPLLKQAMIAESNLYFHHLIEQNSSCDCLIDADFTFVNRRLAEHYGLSGIVGQEMRRVAMPEDSLRGGVLTQAAVLKVTGNGTTTSPVRRGAFVLTHLLGTPPAPPPPAVGSIEPDTRGASTIRELLDKHRNDASCAQCHRSIDPPGFALEVFDVIGGLRSRYRSREQGDPVDATLRGRRIWEYKWGPAVDPSGTLPSGETFADFREFQRLLLRQRDAVARHLLSQWIAFATGAEIEFADRQELDRLADTCRHDAYGLRRMIHEVVQSPLFRHK